MKRHLFISTVAAVWAVFFAGMTVANAASLSLSPSSGEYSVGQTFSVRVVVASADRALNAVSGQISFNPSQLRVVSLSKSNSILSLWAQEPSFSNAAGWVKFEGIVLDPGYTGGGGTVLTIQFRPAVTGGTSLKYTDSEVLANDGKATSIITGASGASYAIIPAAATPPPAVQGTPRVTEQPEVSYDLTVPAIPPPACVVVPDKGFTRIGSLTFTLLETILLSLIILFCTFFLGRYSVLVSHKHLRRQLGSKKLDY